MQPNTLSIFTIIIAAGILSSCNTSSSKPGEAAPAARSAEAKSEYLEAAPNIKFHVTDWEQGRPVILAYGYPLSDTSWKYQYHDLLKTGYRVIGITSIGFRQSDKPYNHYNDNEFAADIKGVLDKLDIKDAIPG